MKFIKAIRNLFNLLQHIEVDDDSLVVSWKNSSITFTSNGDVLIKADGNYVVDSTYIFLNCQPEFIDSISEEVEVPLEPEISKETNLINLEAYRQRKEQKAECLAV